MPRDLRILIAFLALGAFREAAARKPPPSSDDTQHNAYLGFHINPTIERSTEQRSAVKLVYLMTDDRKHQSPQSQGMLEMLDKLPQKHVHNVVFRDGNTRDDSRLFYLRNVEKQSDGLRAAESLLAPGVKEVQSNSPTVLSQVVSWTFSNYAGQRKYLEIYTHGGGVAGMGKDKRQTDTNGKRLPSEQRFKSYMPLPKLSEALETGLTGRKLDAIYLRSCLMGNIEALYQIRNTTKFAIASEQVSYSVENSNLTMTRLFDELAAKDVEPRELARQMSIQAQARKGGESMGYDTIAAVDMSKLAPLKSAINSLTHQLKGAMGKEGAAIVAAYDAVPRLRHNMRDLWRFTSELLERVKDPGVLHAVAEVRQAQRDALIHERDDLGAKAGGLSIFMPSRRAITPAMERVGYGATRFAEDTGWDEFLKSLPPPPESPKIRLPH